MTSNFLEWLERETDITFKSRRDIVSRLKRVSNFINIDKVENDEEVRYLLSQNKNFMALSIFVQSQLKRSIHLYLMFRSQKTLGA